MGRSLPAVKEPPPQLDGTRLDSCLTEAHQALSDALASWRELKPVLDDMVIALRGGLAKFLNDPDSEQTYVSRRDGKPVPRETWLREAGSDLLVIAERVSRVTRNMVQVIDQSARLRQFLVGDAGTAPNLSTASDAELIRLLIDVVIARGLWRAVRERAIEMGVQLDG